MNQEDLRRELDMVLSQLRGMAEPDASRLAFLFGRVAVLRDAARAVRDSGEADPGWMLRVDGDLDEAARLASIPCAQAYSSPPPNNRKAYVGTMGRPSRPVVPAESRRTRPRPPRAGLEQFVGGSVMGVLAAGLIFVAMILFGMELFPLLDEWARLALLSLASCGAGILGYMKCRKDWSDKAWLTVLAIGAGGLFVTAMLAAAWYPALGARIAVYVAVLIWAAGCRVLSRRAGVLFAAIGETGVAIAASAAYVQAFGAGDGTLLWLVPAFLAAAGIILLFRDAGPSRIMIHMGGTSAVLLAAGWAYTSSRWDTWFAYGYEPAAVTALPEFFPQMALLFLLAVMVGIAWILLFRSEEGRARTAFQVLLLLAALSTAWLLDDGFLAGIFCAVWCLAYTAAQFPGRAFAGPVLAALAIALLMEDPAAAVAFLLAAFYVAGLRGHRFLQGTLVGLWVLLAARYLLDVGNPVIAGGGMLLALSMAFWSAYDREAGYGFRSAARAMCVLSTGYATMSFSHAVVQAEVPLAETASLAACLCVGAAVVAVLLALLYRNGSDRILETGACPYATRMVTPMGLPVIAADLAMGIWAVCGGGSVGMMGRLDRAAFLGLAGILLARILLDDSRLTGRISSACVSFCGMAYLWSFRDDPLWHSAAVLLVLGAHGTNLRLLADLRFGPYYVAAKSALVFWAIIASYGGPGWLSTASFFLLAAAMLAVGAWTRRKGLRLAGILLTCFAICKLLLLDLEYGSGFARTAGVLAAGLLCLGVSICYHRFGGSREEAEP